MPDLLIELLSEEIPARMQAKAADDLRRLVTDGLVEAGLPYAHAQAFATPRRLALAVEGLAERSRPVREERKGPAATAPDAAIQGFLRSTGLSLDQLERRQDKKGETLFAVIERPGREAAAIVAEVLDRAIRDFPWPKSMRWGSGSLRWVRPLQSILCILTREDGHALVPFAIEGLTAGDTTRGHRFHAPAAFSVASFEDYESKLKRAHVILSREERRDRIRHDAATLAFAQGLEVVEDEGLLAEIAGLVEWPVTLLGRIEPEFLDLPPEVLRTSMKEHQKFLSVRNPATGRIEGFVTVANLETADHGATILAGNAKVLRARLSDARFFWENDLRVVRSTFRREEVDLEFPGMSQWLFQLDKVVYHEKAGSQGNRVQRIADIAVRLSIDLNIAVLEDELMDAAKFAKADLASQMVSEFPELEGLMGSYYALEAGFGQNVATAIREHYLPLGPSDHLPSTPLGTLVSLADKIDHICSLFSVGERPTGSKDPFALRRTALGIIRILLANDLRIELVGSGVAAISLRSIFDEPKLSYDLPLARQDLTAAESALREAQSAFDGTAAGANKEGLRQFVEQRAKEVAVAQARQAQILSKLNEVGALRQQVPADLLAFLHDRLKVHLRDQGIPHDVIDAGLAMPGNDDLVLLVRRAEALAAFLATSDGTNLVQLFKRANNILAQAEAKDGVEYSFGADPKFAAGEEERALFAALDAAAPRIDAAMGAEDFPAAMTALASLRAPLDRFLEAVQVNSDNGVLRRNRLNLLHRIRTLCLAVADLTRLS